jgi:hypothetical protein
MGLAGAIGVHALIFASVGRRPIDSPDDSIPVALELEETPAPELAPSPTPEPGPAPESAPAPRATAAPALSPATAMAPAPSSSAALEPAPSGAPEAPLDFSAPGARLSADQLGLGGRNVFLGAFRQAPHEAPAPEPTDTAPDGTRNVAPGIGKSIRTALNEHDHELGLDVGGAVIGVAESVARPSDTPDDSTAVFQITADANGNITSVILVDATQGRTAWEPVAASIATALRAKRLAMRGHAGAVITLEVSSRWALPSGSRAGHSVGLTGAGPSESGAALDGKFDLSDIGARPARSVHARILHEEFP